MLKKYLFILLFSCLLYGKDHALIITIGDYNGLASPLPGTKKDEINAREIGHFLGFDISQNIFLLKDKFATRNNVFRALDKINSNLAKDDRVYIYYSGHGSSGINRYTNQCESSLFTSDGQDIFTDELIRELHKLNKAKVVFTFFDACHSGDFPNIFSEKNRSITRQYSNFTPKFASKTGAQQCKESVNTRSIVFDKNNQNLPSNVMILAAAKDNEVAWDDNEKGGLASNAFLQCMQNNSHDRNVSNKETMSFLVLCAQQNIDQKFLEEPNRNQHLVFKSIQSSDDVLPDINVLLEEFMNHPDKIYTLKLSAQQIVNVKQPLNLRLTSPIDGYLTLVDFDPINKKITILKDNIPIEKNKMQDIADIEGDTPGISYLLAIVNPTFLNNNQLEGLLEQSIYKNITRSVRITNDKKNIQPYAAAYMEVIVK